MSDERTIAPSPARQRLAWSAGLRPSSGWALPTLAMAVLAVAVDQALRTDEVWFDVTPAATSPGEWLTQVGAWMVAVWLVALLLVLAAALVLRQLGGVSRPAVTRLGAAAVRPSPWLRAGLAIGSTCVALGVLRGVLAGASRSVAASETGLAELWAVWAVRGVATVAGVLAVATIVDLLLDHRQRWGRLLQSRQQRRDEARAGQGARR